MLKRIFNISIGQSLFQKKFYSTTTWNKNKTNAIEVRNWNFRFQLQGWNMHLFPFHPKIQKKSNNIYDIVRNSQVLAITFVPKVDGLPDDQAWQSRKSMSFKFEQLGPLISFNQGIIKKQKISTIKDYKDKQYIKQFIIESKTDGMQIKLISNIIDKAKDEKSLEYQLQVNMTHSDYCLLKNIIKNSLGDLSGWKLMLDFQKQKMLSEVKLQQNIRENIDFLNQYDNQNLN